jgi:hypothetical protein
MDADRLIAQAMGNDHKAAADLWRAIASGEIDDDLVVTWTRHVASLVVADVLDADIESNRRAEAALHALRISGRQDQHGELRKLVASIESCADLIGVDTRADFVRTVQYQGFLKDKSLGAAKKVVDRIRKK